jgi:hypothetical protein
MQDQNSPTLNRYFIKLLYVLRDNASIITAGLALLGLIKLILFYMCFDINILEYVTFTDLIISVTKETLIMVTVIIIVIFLLFVTDAKIKKPTNLNNEEGVLLESSFLDINRSLESYIKRISSKTTKIYFWALFIGIFLIDRILANQIKTFPTYLLSTSSVIIFGIFIALFILEDTKPSSLTLLMMLFIFYIFFVLFLSLRNVIPIMKGKYNGSIVKTTLKEYISSDSLVYIGKSIDYTFFYNTELKRSEIVSNTNVLSYSITENPLRKIYFKKKMPVLKQNNPE